jgi:hypothetical protein
MIPTTRTLLQTLVRLGTELVSVHILESGALIGTKGAYIGPSNPMVRRIGWSNETVWLDAPAASKNQKVRDGTVGFRAVPEPVWDFHIGGYRVCEKWLKDRRGRTLSANEVDHYQRILDAIREMIRVMAEIDDVITEHGGWPHAFSGST